jgi:hypothetical protein
MMQEKRQSTRKIANNTIQIHDLNTGRLLGQVVNLTSDGLMLISPQPIESNLVFQMELILQDQNHHQHNIRIGAESLWCSGANEPGYFWAGFQIIDISLDTIEFIESLMKSWQTDDAWH